MTTKDITLLITGDKKTIKAKFPNEEPCIAITNVKFHPDMSDETMCFSADILLGNKKAGICSNDGKGGCTNWCGNTPLNTQQLNTLDAKLKTVIDEHIPTTTYSLDDLLYDMVASYITENNPTQKVW